MSASVEVLKKKKISRKGRFLYSENEQRSGILGRLDGGTVTGCTRADAVVVYSYAEQDTGRNSSSAVRSAAGGIVGCGSSSSVTGCTSSSSNLEAAWTVGSKTASSSYRQTGAVIGRG